MLVPLEVADVMVSPVETVGERVTARDVSERLAAASIGSLVVVDGATPVGIVTESDLVRIVADGTDVDAVTVADVMSADLVTVEPDATVERAAALFDDHDVRRLPVVDGDGLVGIVTTADLSRYLPKLVHHGHAVGPDREPRYVVRPDTAYEEGDWKFESRSVDEGEVGVGDVVEFSKTLGDDDVRSFANASGDTNRLHLEEAYAEQTRFGARIVHGTLVAGLVSAALARLPGLTIYMSQDLTFHAPVRVGERVTAVCEVVEALGGDRFLLTTDVYGDDETGQVIEGEAVVLINELPQSAHVQVEQVA